MKCSEKIGYQTKSEALIAASQLTRPPKRKQAELKPYRPYKLRAYSCQCGKWHLTKRIRK